MRERDLFVLADRAREAVIKQIRPEQWDLQMPPHFATGAPDTTITLPDIINDRACDAAWVPDMPAGRTRGEVGADRHRGDLLHEDPAASCWAFVDAGCAAAQQLNDPERTVHCSFGDVPARECLWQMSSFRGLRAHSCAQDRLLGMTGRAPDGPPAAP